MCQDIEKIKRNKVDMLNILRVIAFLMVFFLHSKIFIPVNWNENFNNAWIIYTPAWAGVWIFFILSGYGIGSGFVNKKYQVSCDGILKYYCKRIMSIVPLYWLYLLVVIVFVRPDIIIPSQQNIVYLLKLFLFNYQEEFYSTEFGLAWYMTTLMRLYLIAPLIYYVINRFLKTKKRIIISGIALISIGIVARCLVGYHIAKTGVGDWSPNIYKPFYFNLDIFGIGILLSFLKKKVEANKNKLFDKLSFLKPVPFILFIMLVLSNSYIYYASSYNGKNLMYIYEYIFPTVYIIISSLYIYTYDINRTFEYSKLSKDDLHHNKLRIFDYFKYVQGEMYFFHSTVLYILSKSYNDDVYTQFCYRFGLSDPNKMSIYKGFIFTFLALLLTFLWSMVIQSFMRKIDTKRLEIWLYNLIMKIWSKGKFYIKKILLLPE